MSLILRCEQAHRVGTVAKDAVETFATERSGAILPFITIVRIATGDTIKTSARRLDSAKSAG